MILIGGSAFEACQLEQENCTCEENERGDIQMSCVEIRFNMLIYLNLSQLSIEQSNKWIRLTIRNKFINQIKTSEMGLSQMITSLRIDECEMRELKENSFLHMQSLTELFLTNDHLESIQVNAFRYIDSNLKILVIASNNIRQIHFEMLINLNFLDLTNNDIDEICLSTTNVTYLALESNRIKVIQNDFFRKLTRLINLRLFENQMESI